MGEQLSLKAAMPLAEILATCRKNVSNTGPWADELQRVPTVGLDSSDQASVAAIHPEPSVMGECASLGDAASPPMEVSEVDPPLPPTKPSSIL